MSRSLRRRAVLAAALPAALAAVALPAAAEAATVELVNSGGNGVVAYSGEPGESNNIRVSLTAAGIVIADQVPIRRLDSECVLNATGDAVCPGSAGQILVFGRDRNDTIQYTAPHGGGVFGGDGADLFLAGLRQAGFGRQIEPVGYDGKDRNHDPVNDTVSYRHADRGVRVALDDAGSPISFDDGRSGDLEGIANDIDVIEGSNFDDPQLFGSNRDEIFRGLAGNDVIGTGGGSDIIDEGATPNGADTLNGGNGDNDRIKYGTRTSGVDISLDGVRNDGAPGERDDVGPGVENIVGSQHGDRLSGNGSANILEGLAGIDTIDGAGGNDTVNGGLGSDTLLGSGGNDVIRAKDGVGDTVGCGSEIDSAELDSLDGHSGCETRSVGVLRLAPKALAAETGEPARLRLRWRHPQTWRKLRKVELRLLGDGAPVGEVTIRPRGERLSAEGAVELLRKQTRLLRKGKTVVARLALRLDKSLAGQTLTAEVEATDVRGARQLETDAAKVSVGG